MDTGSNYSDCICVVHFEGKEGQIKKLTQDTLEKIIERRKQWLGLTSPYKNFTEVAKTSLEYIPEQPESLDVNDIAENFCYHTACYRNFTDISKFESAKNTLKNADRKRSGDSCSEKDGEFGARPNKVTRNTRQSFGITCAASSSGSSNVLSQVCLVCKQPGPIFITDTVCSPYIQLHCSHQLIFI